VQGFTTDVHTPGLLQTIYLTLFQYPGWKGRPLVGCLRSWVPLRYWADRKRRDSLQCIIPIPHCARRKSRWKVILNDGKLKPPPVCFAAGVVPDSHLYFRLETPLVSARFGNVSGWNKLLIKQFERVLTPLPWMVGTAWSLKMIPYHRRNPG